MVSSLSHDPGDAGGAAHSVPTFTPEELHAIVDETHRERHKVAAHVMGLGGTHNAVEAGADLERRHGPTF